MEYILPEASIEQLEIINNIRTNNVIVDAVAGSGKTTTILHIANTLMNMNILLLTYNKKLRLETNNKKKLLNVKNLEIHTYHSYCVRYLNMKGYTDYELRESLENIITNSIKYDIIIIDEAQDLTELYFNLVSKIINNNLKSRLLIMGDRYQSIYKFNNADERYIIYANDIFNYNQYNWKRINLSISYRLTNTMANFINQCVLGTNRIKSIKTGCDVKYYIINTFKPDYIINNILKLHSSDFITDDIFILSPSVKKSSSSPIRRLANKLTKLNVPIYIPGNDNESLDDDILKGKLVFSTFHQVKGLERKRVVVFGFDESYFNYIAKNDNKNICPNTIYVAITRAIDELIIIHDYKNKYLPFLNDKILPQIVTLITDKKIEKNTKKDIMLLSVSISVVDLIKHIPSDIIYQAYNYFKIELIDSGDYFIDIPIKTKQDNLYENVSDITGIAVVAYFELTMKGVMNMIEYILINKDNYKDYPEYYNIINDTLITNIDIETLLRLAILYDASCNKYYFRLKQIKYLNWLNQSNLDLCIQRLSKKITNNAIFEKPIKGNILNYEINGRIDCIDNTSTNNIWEIKTVKELSKEHFIQLACYAYLAETELVTKNTKLDRNYYLYNILSNETYKIVFNLNDLKTMIELLVTSKIGNHNNINDDLFKNQANKIRVNANIRHKPLFNPNDFDL